MSKIIVMSADAMVGQDTELLKTLPNFKKYLAGGSEIKAVKSIYPTVTYPAHTTMCTGAYPERHGIISNFPFSTKGKNLPWFWFHDAVKCDDIFSAAKRAGKTTAAVFWPVTGCHPDIDYLIDEYWSQYPGEPLDEVFTRAGSNEYALSVIAKYNDTYKDQQRQHPGADEFIIDAACDIIRDKQPDLLMIHPANIDGYRHGKGLFGEHVDRGVYETDEWIGKLCKACEDAGVLEDTNFFLVSDHGQLEIKRSIHINVLLADNGLIDVDSDGNVTSWRAYCTSTGMSALVYLSDPEDKALYNKVYELLCHLRDEGVYGFNSFKTREETAREDHLDGDFSFVLETDGYTSFGDLAVRPLVRPCSNTDDYRFGNATHGYHPSKGPQPILFAKGPDIKNGVVLEESCIVHEAPTYAKIFGTELKDAQGCAIDEILK